MANPNEVIKIWKDADAVTFDVDSTVIQEEGIDELAKFCGKGDDVAALTREAMQGNMTFEESLRKRLFIIMPTLTQVKEFLSTHPPKLTPGIKPLIAALHSRRKEVFLISGGFHCLIAPVAAQLNIPSTNIFANRLKFFFNGEFAGFDETEPTAKSCGKAKVIHRLKEQYGFKTVVHIGDGVTDLDTVPPAASFIGYGGNVIRNRVKSHAPLFITDFDELVKVL